MGEGKLFVAKMVFEFISSMGLGGGPPELAAPRVVGLKLGLGYDPGCGSTDLVSAGEVAISSPTFFPWFWVCGSAE